MRFKTLPIFLAFFLMGLADAMGPMSDGVKKQYELSNLVATLLPFFVFIAFAIFSIPGGLLAARSARRNCCSWGLGSTRLHCWSHRFKCRVLRFCLRASSFSALAQPSFKSQAIPSCAM